MKEAGEMALRVKALAAKPYVQVLRLNDEKRE